MVSEEALQKKSGLKPKGDFCGHKRSNQAFAKADMVLHRMAASLLKHAVPYMDGLAFFENHKGDSILKSF